MPKLKANTSKYPQISANINQYFNIEADDYHEFDWIVKYFKSAGIDVEYEEVGCDGSFYHAVFWVGEKPIEYIKCKKLQFGDE